MNELAIFFENTFYDGKEVTDPYLQEYVNDILKQIVIKMKLNILFD